MKIRFRYRQAFVLAFCLITGLAADYSAAYYYDQAVNLEKSGDTIRAADMLRESLRKNADHVPSLLMLARIAADSMQHRTATDLVARAMKLDAANDTAGILCARIAYAIKDSARLESCLQSVEARRKNHPDAQSLRARLMIDSGQYAVAKRKLDAILRDHPGHTETNLALAGLYLKLRQFAKAEAEFRKIQAFVADNSNLSVAIARARLDAFFKGPGAGDFSPDSEAAVRALEALRHAYAVSRDNLAVNLMMAQLLAITGRCGDAADYLQKAAGAAATARSVVTFNAVCDATTGEKLLGDYLKLNEDDDLSRHQYELLQLTQGRKREHAGATKAARYHRSLAKREMQQNADAFSLAELRWSEFLFPGYIEAHRDLLRYFRIKKDYERMGDELRFLRDATGGREYRELFEQYESEQRDLWYNKEGIQNPEQQKNPLPIHIYPLRPVDPLADHPLGGAALADRTRVALMDYGRVRSISRDMAALPVAQKFTPENLRRLRQTYAEALRAEGHEHPFLRQQLSLALAGEFTEITNGVEVTAEILEAESGIRVATLRFKASGRDFLNRAAVRLAAFIFENAQLSSNILRVLDDQRILVNTGKRDRLPKDAQFSAIDKQGRTIAFKMVRRDFDILEARSDQADATKHLKAGDVVQLVR